MSTATNEQVTFYRAVQKQLRSQDKLGTSQAGADVALNKIAVEIEKATGLVKSRAEVKAIGSFAYKIAASVSEKQWLEYCASGELPPIKLAPREMESATGGIAPFLIWGAYIAGMAFVAWLGTDPSPTQELVDQNRALYGG